MFELSVDPATAAGLRDPVAKFGRVHTPEQRFKLAKEVAHHFSSELLVCLVRNAFAVSMSQSFDGLAV